MIRRPLALALALALLPAAGAHAEDLMQTYELARAGDPQLAIAESNRLITIITMVFGIRGRTCCSKATP